MKREEIIEQSEEEFRRYTGIPTWLFWEMTAILIRAKREKAARGGRKTKLSCWEMLLMALEYWREYRTYFHVGVRYGVSESNCWKIIVWIENVLMKSGEYRIPGKSALLSNEKIERVMIDTTEREIERPKKTGNVRRSQSRTGRTSKKSIIRVSRNAIR